MTLRTKTIASACAALALGFAWAAAAQPALARWTFHDSSVGETITAPPGGTRAQTCADQLAAVSGYAYYIDVDGGEDPATYQIPSEAMTALDYELWKAPPGFHNFDSAVGDLDGVYFEDASGARHDATLVATVTTPVRAVLPTPVPAEGNPNASDNFVFTTAPISVSLSGVAPGDALALRPKEDYGGIFVEVTAMDCGVAVLKAKVDVIPGSRANRVHPNNGDLSYGRGDDLVPVWIFGSKRLRVRRITEVHLGEAAPVSVPARLQPSLRPKDVNHDGRPDRLYYFRQGDTDMMCIDTSVKVTGQTSDHKRFQAGQPITTAGCAG
jgi:hypothetical protein